VKRNNKGNIVQHTREKRTDVDIGKETIHREKSKVVREPVIQAIKEDDLDKITDQFKEEIDESFECITKKQEERHSYMQANIVVL